MRELDGAVVVEFPLRGEWRAVNTPGTRIPSHGTDILGQRYAYDFLRTDERDGWNVHPVGAVRYTLVGVPTRESYAWGEPVHAVQDGAVVAAVDGVRERAWLHPAREVAGALWRSLTYDPRKPYEVLAGNHVLIGSGDTVAVFAHLATGSVAVGTGDAVRAGELIGRVGHTGNSTAPHLHFQLMDGTDPTTARGVPAAFRAYEVWRGGAWERVAGGIPARSDRIRSVA